MFYQLVVSRAIFDTVVCWGADLNKLVRKSTAVIRGVIELDFLGGDSGDKDANQASKQSKQHLPFPP